MSAKTASSIGELRALSSAALFEPAVVRLAAAARSDRASAIQQHLAEAIPFLGGLSPSMQRLAWLQTFGMPRDRRHAPALAQMDLWRRGINRVAETCPHSCGLAPLAMGLSEVPCDAGVSLLRAIASTHALETLLGDASHEALAWEGVWMMQAINPAGCTNIRLLARDASIDTLSEVAALAEWLHALATDGAEPVHPPASRLTDIALVLTQLRGLRRRGAREHGRRIGRHVRQTMRTLSRGSTRELDVELPRCVIGSEPMRPRLAPLVQDLLSSAVAEADPSTDLREASRAISECCPALIDQAIAAHSFPGSHAPTDTRDRPYWLESLLGLVPFEERHAAMDEESGSAQTHSHDPEMETTE